MEIKTFWAKKHSTSTLSSLQQMKCLLVQLNKRPGVIASQGKTEQYFCINCNMPTPLLLYKELANCFCLKKDASLLHFGRINWVWVQEKGDPLKSTHRCILSVNSTRSTRISVACYVAEITALFYVRKV